MKGVTAYQLEVLRLAGGRNPEGEGGIDFDQLLDRLSWVPTKQAAQFTIRACISKGLLEKGPLTQRRGRHRVTYQLTEDGKQVLDPRSGTGVEVSADPHKGVEIVVPELEIPVPEPLLDPGVIDFSDPI